MVGQPTVERQPLWSVVLLSSLLFLPPAFFVLLSVTLAQQSRTGVLEVRGGFADLTPYADRNGTLFLRGEYEFLSGDTRTYRSVPDQWRDTEAGSTGGFGYGVYRLRLRLDRSRRWGLKITTAATSWRLKAADRELAHAGNPSPNPRTAVASYRPTIVLLPDAEMVDLWLEVSNWEYRVGGLWRAPEIGPYVQMRQTQSLMNTTSLGLAFSLATLAVLALVGFLIGSGTLSLIYLAMLCLLYSLRALVTGDYLLTLLWTDIPFDVLIRLEYLTIYALVPTTCLFLTEIFETLPWRRTWRGLMTIYSPLLVALPFLPLPILTRTLLPVGLGNLLFSLILLFLPLVLLRTDQYFIILSYFSGGLTLFAALINDVLHNNFLIQTVNLLPWAQYVYCLMLGSIVLRQTSRTFRENRLLTRSLQESNERLRKQIEISETAKQEIYHQVRNNLQIINSIISLERERLTSPLTNTVALRALQLRISALGLAQEHILDSVGTEEIDLIAYIQEILRLVRFNLFTQVIQIRVLNDIRTLPIEKQKCRDIGMILIEFIVYHIESLSTIDSIEVQVWDIPSKDAVVEIKLTGRIVACEEKDRRDVNLSIIRSYCAKNGFDFEVGCGANLAVLRLKHSRSGRSTE